MRTTLSIDTDILTAAKRIAAARSVSVGDVISELARRGLEARAVTGSRDGFPVFAVADLSQPLTLEHVRQDDDDA